MRAFQKPTQQQQHALQALRVKRHSEAAAKPLQSDRLCACTDSAAVSISSDTSVMR